MSLRSPSSVIWLRKAGALAGTAALAAGMLFALLYALSPVLLARAGLRAASDSPQGGVPLVVSFQGRVLVQGSSYNGVGYFKFAVVNAAGNTSYWSNDGTSSAGGEPTASVPLTVSNGLFTVLLGDTTQGGMSSPLGAATFNAADRRLRVWFSASGTAGSFERLSPDQVVGSTAFALNAGALGGVDSATYVQAGQGVSRLANDSGYISQTLADGRYARNRPTPQQLALLKWYTAISSTGTTFGVGLLPGAVAFDGEYVWVTNYFSNNVSVLRASDGYRVMTPTVGANPIGLAFDGANVWVTNQGSNSVSVLRASDGALVMTPTVGAYPTGVAFDGTNVWVVNSGSDSVSVLRASDGTHIMTPTVGTQPLGVAFDGANVWVVNFASNSVSVLRASDGYHVMTPTVGLDPSGIAFDGTYMWVTNRGSDSVSVLRVSDGALVMNVPAGPVPEGIAFDGANMWVANASGNSVSKR